MPGEKEGLKSSRHLRNIERISELRSDIDRLTQDRNFHEAEKETYRLALLVKQELTSILEDCEFKIHKVYIRSWPSHEVGKQK